MSTAVPRTSAGASSTVRVKLLSPSVPRAWPAVHSTAPPGPDRTVKTSLRVLGLAGSSHAFICRKTVSGVSAAATTARKANAATVWVATRHQSTKRSTSWCLGGESYSERGNVRLVSARVVVPGSLGRGGVRRGSGRTVLHLRRALGAGVHAPDHAALAVLDGADRSSRHHRHQSPARSRLSRHRRD